MELFIGLHVCYYANINERSKIMSFVEFYEIYHNASAEFKNQIETFLTEHQTQSEDQETGSDTFGTAPSL